MNNINEGPIEKGYIINTNMNTVTVKEAMDAIKEILAQPVQPEQEPVAWMVTYGGLTHIAYTKPTHVVDTHYQPLYASPPHRKQLTNDEN